MNKYDYFITFGLVLWFLQSWYFGFNIVAQSGAEKILDNISAVIIAYGLIAGIGSSVKTTVNVTNK